MFKTLTLIYFFAVLAFNSVSYANESYKIVVKVNDEIISNHDIVKEKNTYQL